MLETYIDKKLILDSNYDDTRTSSIGSDDAIVILNPTKYTIQDDEFDDEGHENNDEE